MLRVGREEEEAAAAYECSTECQSGWTMYLDQSYENLTPSVSYKKGGGGGSHHLEEEEEEDLSMVSDASSGPPQFHEEYSYCCYSTAAAAALAKNHGKKRRVEAEQQPQPKEHSFLDDTASSPLFSFSKANRKNDASEDHVLEFSSSFSATHYKRNPNHALEKHLDYMQSPSPLKPSPARPACREEEEKMW